MSQPKPFIFGTNQLSQFIFRWIGSPFKSLHNKLQNQANDSNQQHPQDGTQTIQPEPNATHETITTPQNEPSITIDRMAEPLPPTESSLPTAFMPHFPSLSRPSTSTRSSNYAGSDSVRSGSSTRSLVSTQHRLPSRRTLYIGPGHSSMNSSTRLGLARRQRLGMSGSSNVLGSSYDAASQVAPESPKAAHPKPNYSLDFSQEQASSRTQLNNQPDNPSGLASPFRDQLQPASSLNPMPSRHPPKIDNPNVRAIKNSNVTPMRPSPLRNVTLASVASSPPSQRESSPDSLITPSSRPKRRNHRQAASIMSSVMKEVNLEISNRSPVPSPIKPSQVINPYAQLHQRPIKERLKSQPTRPKKFSVHPDTNLQESESRRRRVQVCLDGDIANHPSDLTKNNHKDDDTTHQHPIERMLQKTIPKEFRPEHTSGNDAVQKRKTRHVGKLPERVLKKQKLREQETSPSNPPVQDNLDQVTSHSNKSSPFPSSLPSSVSPSTNHQDSKSPNGQDDNPSKTNLSKPSPSTPDKSSQMKTNSLNNSQPAGAPSLVKTFQQVPSSSLFGTTNLNSKSASTRSSLMSAKHQLVTPSENANNQKNLNGSSASHSSTTGSGGGAPLFNGSLSKPADRLSSPIHFNMKQSSHFDLQNKASQSEEKVGGKDKAKMEERQGASGIVKEKTGDGEDEVMDTVKELAEEEVQNYFNQDLLIDYSNQPINLSSFTQQHDNNCIDLEFESIKQVVLGIGATEFDSFVLV